MTDVKVPFSPIQGLENVIQKQAIRQGNLYFATDTGKILLDTDQERITLGASGAAVFYSNSDNLTSNTDDSYTVPYNDLDDQHAVPKADDLIINSDGRFFRVNYYDAASAYLNCRLIAVSGTGGGTGGGGGGSDSDDPKVINVVYEDLKYSFLNGSDYIISLTATSAVDTYLNVSYVVVNANNKTVDMGTVSATSGKKVSLNVGKNIAPDGTFHKVTITITGANSYTYTRDITRIKCIDLRVENDTDNFVSQEIYDTTVSYRVKVFGKTAKTLHIEIDGHEVIDPILSGENENNISKSVPINCERLKLDAGVHTITAYLVADGVESNRVHTDFIYHPLTASPATYVIVTGYPETCLSYETPTIEYWVWDTTKGEGISNDITLSINGAVVETITETQRKGSSGKLQWKVTGLIAKQPNKCEITCNNITRSVSIFCEYSNIFDEITDDAIILLNANGRSNSTSLERRLDWRYENYRNEIIKANLIDFNWHNNGWMQDSEGRSCLRISNGAKVEIPLILFTNSKPTTGGFTFEFEFNPYNLYSYNLLTQSTNTVEDDSGADDKVEIQRTFDASLAAIKYIATGADNQAYGFCCGTQDSFFRMSNGDNASIRYMNDTILNVAVTINAANRQICMYVNGIMSGMVTYKNDAELPIYADKLIINSEQCDLDLYNIRIYNKVLSSSEISQNYIASKKDLVIHEENNFASGDVVNLNELISYNMDNPSNATIPYVIFKTKDDDNLLPYNKANADVICDVKFTNPALDYALSVGEIDEEYYKKHAPSFLAEDVVLNVQGTSSQKYPRKNFKGKFKKPIEKGKMNCTNEAIQDKSLSKFYMRDNIGEKTFTWKADFMDSSSCHNTGFVSYVYDLYQNHPLDYYEGTNATIGGNEIGLYHSKYRTSLFGFPVLAFHEKSDGSTEFIGVYNFNLDKSADSTLGMALDKQHKILTDKTYEEVCECWEMANNLGGRCSFKGNPFDQGYDYVKKKYVGYDANGKEFENHSDLGDDIEVRYHINKDAIEGALENLDAPADDDGKYIGSEKAFEVLLGGDADGNGRTGAYAHLERFFKWIQDCFYAFDLSKDTDQTWLRELLDREDEIVETDEDYQELIANRKVKFESEFDDHLNKEYCMIYYIMTELLLQFDSRGKNMMFSSWGPMKEGGEYIWFPIYYDVDTQLGVNNSGVPSWEYNVEPSTGFNNNNVPAFSTNNSLLWLNFHESFVVGNNQVRDYYRTLRGRNLTIAKLNGYYNFDYNISKDYCMKGILPINIINANQYYKYIDPSITGYVNGIDDAGNPIMRKTDAYFYCLQGTRELHRALFLRNRFNYYDSKWMAQSYQPGATGGTDQFWRVNSFKHPEDSSLDSNILLHVKPALDQYIVIWLDDSGTNVHPVYARGGETVEIDLLPFASDGYNQQIIHIGGPNYIQEYGNVSLLYLDEFDYISPLVVKIEMGNENEKYIPDIRFGSNDGLASSTGNKPLLKVFDITNIRNVSKKVESLDLSSSIKLEEFKALGTELNSVTFADGVNLQKLYLPDTLNKIELSNATSLDKIVYNKNEIYEVVDGVNKQNKPVMYIDKLIKDDETTNIGTISIIGGGLKQYSYDLLRKITEAHQTDKMKDSKLAINMEDVHWTPYTQLGEGAVYDNTKANKYMYATNNASFETYAYTNENTWNVDLLSGRIYYNDGSEVELADSLAILDAYINDKKNKFINVTNELKKDYPVITGSMYVENNAANSISEADLFNKYAQYFPDLDIRAKYITNAYRARFVSYVDGVEKEIYVQRIAKGQSETVNVELPTVAIPVPSHSVFMGWSLVKPTGDYQTDAQYIKSDDWIKQCSFGIATGNEQISEEFVFYAVYDSKSYDISFIDSTAIEGEERYQLTYKALYGEILPDPPMPSRDYEESLMPLVERIAFKGWTPTEASSGIVSTEAAAASAVVDLSTYVADKNYIFYPVYIKENVYDKPTDEKYFEADLDHLVTIGEVTGCELKVRATVTGKVTIPATYKGKPVVAIKEMQQAFGAKHIFFMKNDKFRKVNDNAFNARDYEGVKLEGIYLPESVIEIGSFAFDSLKTLKYINESYVNDSSKLGHLSDNIETIGNRAFRGAEQLYITSLPSKLQIIDEYAFSSCKELTISQLPKSVTTIKLAAFLGCTKIRIQHFGGRKNEVDGSKLAVIEASAFNIGNSSGFQNIYVYDTVTTLDTNAFAGYGEVGNLTLYTTHPSKPAGWPDTLKDVTYVSYGYTGEV